MLQSQEKSSIQPPFVGESRIRLVAGLMTIYDQVVSTKEPRWISIEAPSGWGKTRVIQEFYTYLANRQDKRYWPNSILEASDIDYLDVATRRKRVFPEPAYIHREYGVLPAYMWGELLAHSGTV